MMQSKTDLGVTMGRSYCAVAAIVVGCFSTGGRADSITPHVNIACNPQKNIAIVRFAEASNEDAPVYASLPKAVDRGLAVNPASAQQSCRLSNGWEVKVRIGSGQAFPYGMGGGSPPGFFSLWIDRRKVVSGEVWTSYSYAETLTPLAAVAITPDKLTFCRGTNRVTCTTQRLDLGRYQIDPVEYPAAGAERLPAGSIKIVTGADTPVCRRLVTKTQGEDGIGSDQLNLSDENDVIGTWPLVSDLGGVFGIGDQQGRGFTTFSPDGADDVDGDGVEETVVGRFGENRYFDGSYWIVAPKDVRVIDVLRRVYPGERLDEEAAIELAEQQGWQVYSGGRPGLYADVSPRYVRMEMLRFGGDAFFLARPTNREHRPTAVLIRPKPPKGSETVCIFQEILPNF